MAEDYFIGQRVLIYGREIGHVIPATMHEWKPGYICVRDYSGVCRQYAEHNIKPLPNGQL